MRRTRPADLAIPFFIIGVTVYVLLRVAYSALPPLQSYVPVPLAALAIAELVAARRVRAAVRHDPDAKAMAAIVIARCVALGKASSLVGSGMVGAAVGLLARVVPESGVVRSAGNDTRVAIFLIVASLLLVVAGLLLERAGVDPGSHDREPRNPSS